MGLTENQKNLIQAISKNDMVSAKKCALSCITEDNTQKNKYWCSRYKSILENSKNMIELPYDLKNIICVEDVSTSFREERYFLTDREKGIYDDIIRMKEISERLAEIGLSYKNSTLLYGESGTGKTTFGKYVAYKIGIPFCYLNFSNLVDSHMGATSKNISQAFGYAMSNPCVLMLDEIDCISIRRGGISTSVDGEMARITITLMQEFDKLTNNAVIIGATNRIDMIDEALLRRFSLKHEIKSLTEKESRIATQKFLDDINMVVQNKDIEELLVKSNGNQANLINGLIKMVSKNIYYELIREKSRRLLTQ